MSAVPLQAFHKLYEIIIPSISKKPDFLKLLKL